MLAGVDGVLLRGYDPRVKSLLEHVRQQVVLHSIDVDREVISSLWAPYLHIHEVGPEMRIANFLHILYSECTVNSQQVGKTVAKRREGAHNHGEVWVFDSHLSLETYSQSAL